LNFCFAKFAFNSSAQFKLYQTFKKVGKYYLIVMSPSQNFPAQAEPSYEGSEPSQAELSWGTSISELKPS
jgi:hypothetical protein